MSISHPAHLHPGNIDDAMGAGAMGGLVICRDAPCGYPGGGWVGALGIAVMLFIFLALLAFPLTASAHSLAGNGRVYGQLLDGSKHNAPVAGQSVTLQMAQGGNATDLTTVITDAQGRYSFNGLSTDKTINYAVYTLFQRAQYFTDLIDLSSKPVDLVNLTIYDATSSTANLAIAQANVLIDKADAQHGLVTITESYFVENLGLTTYVGSLPAAKGQTPNALRFSLPGGARQLSLKGGFDGYKIATLDSGFVTDAAVLPGLSQFAFSFQVPYNASHYDFSYTAVYPTIDLAVLLPLNYHASSATLEAKGAVTVSGQTYQELSAQKMLAGAQVHVELDGLPATVSVTDAASPGFNPAWFIYIGLAMLVIVAITLYFSMRMRRQARSRAIARQKAVQAKSVPTRKAARAKKNMERRGSEEQALQESLLADLLALDKAYEAGTIKKAEYDERRGSLKAQLRAVMESEVVAQKQPAVKSTKSARSAKTTKTAARSGRK
jgi:5-hydroxyisourate hydrolase-like protein (transthyretin family)